MEKQLSALSYWLGLICTAIALILRLLALVHVAVPYLGGPTGSGISYLSFLRGAELFFLLAIASWCRTAKA